MGKKSRRKREARNNDSSKGIANQKTVQQSNKAKRGGKRILSRKNIIAVCLEIFLWGGGVLLGNIAPYLAATAWLIAVLVLIYYIVPFSRWTERLLNYYQKGHLIANKKLMNILSLSPILILGLVAYFTVFNPVVELMSTQFESEQDRPTLVLEVKNLPFKIDENRRKATILVDFIIKDISDSPAYQARFRQCAALLDDPKNVSAYPDLIETNPIDKVAPKTVHFSYDVTYANQKDVVVLIYTHLRYSDSPDGDTWYELENWLAYQLNLESRTGEVISALPDWKALFKPFVDDFYTKSQKEP